MLVTQCPTFNAITRHSFYSVFLWQDVEMAEEVAPDTKIVDETESEAGKTIVPTTEVDGSDPPGVRDPIPTIEGPDGNPIGVDIPDDVVSHVSQEDDEEKAVGVSPHGRWERLKKKKLRHKCESYEKVKNGKKFQFLFLTAC